MLGTAEFGSDCRQESADGGRNSHKSLNGQELCADLRLREKSGIGREAVSQSGLLFFVSAAEEVTSVADFFSGRNLPMTECFEDFNSSYELIKMGVNKHAFIALRIAVDDGLIAAYWKAKGDRTKEFRRWLRSADPTPHKTRAFWEALFEVPTLRAFSARFPLRQDIVKLDELSNYVHTRGLASQAKPPFRPKSGSARTRSMISGGSLSRHAPEWF